jgi:hypothetical protein
MKGFRIAIVVFALLPIATGLADIVIGTSAWKGIGVSLSEEGLKDSVLDSQIRFLATIWLGYGVLLCLCARDPQKYANILRGALLLAVVGGIARLISLSQVGMPASESGSRFVVFALVIEFVVVPLLLLWQHKALEPATRGGSEV